MNVTQRQDMERRLIIKLLTEMAAAGFHAIHVDDGEDRVKAETQEEVLAAVFAVDESHIIFSAPNGGRHPTAYIVLGNDGYDAIADYSCGHPAFVKVMEEIIDPFTDALSEEFIAAN